MKRVIESAATVGLLTDIIEHAPIRIFWKDREGRYLGCNTLFARDAGLQRPDQLIGKTDFDMGWKHQAELYRADDARLMASGEAKLGCEESQTTPDGRTIWLRTSKVPLKDRQEKVIGILGIYEDITARKQAEQRLVESEKTYRGIFNALNEAVYILDDQGRFIDVNQGAERMYGLPREYFVGRTPADLSAPGRNDMNDVVDKLGLACNGRPQSIEFWACRSNGEIFPKEVHLYPGEYFGRRVVIAIATDIGERKRAEAALLQSEQRLKQAQSIGGVGIWDWNLKTGDLFWSDTVFEMLGLGVGGVQPSYEFFRSMLRPGDRETLDAKLKEALESGETGDMDCHVIRGDGREGIVHLQGQAEYDAQGEPESIMGTVQDITRRKRDEEALSASEQKLNTILDNVEAYIYLKDSQGRYLFANRLVRELWQAGMEGVVGFGDEKFFDAPTTENIRRNDRRVLVDGETVRAEETNTVPLTGVTRTYLSTKLPLYREDGSIYALCGISTDISERKATEHALLESNRHAQSLLRLSRALELAGNDQAIIDAVAGEIQAIIGYRSAWLFMRGEEPDTARMLSAHASGAMRNIEAARSLRISGDAYLEKLVASTEPVIVEDARTDPLTDKRMVDMFGNRSFVNIPILLAGRWVGMLGCGCGSVGDEGVLIPTPAQLEFLTTAATHVSVALERLHLQAERQRAEDRLRASEERLQQAQVIGEVGVWDWDPSSGALVWTEQTFNILGYAVDEVAPSFELFLEHVHPDDRDMLRAAVEAALHRRSKYDIDCRFIRLDGSEGVANAQGQVSFDAAGNPIRMLGTFQDITSRKRTETRLREALSLQMATLEATADGILVVGNEGHWATYNRNFADMWHIPDDILEAGDDQRALDYVLDQLVDPQAFIDKVMALYANPEESSFDVLLFKDGRVFERYSREQRIDERIVGRVWSFRDVSERYQAEQKLREEAEFRSQLMEQASEGIVLWHRGSEGQFAEFLTWNRRMQEISGYTREEINRLGWLQTIYADENEREKAREIMARVLAGGINPGTDCSIVTRAGEHKIVHISSAGVQRHGSDRCVLSVIQDVTQGKKQQALLEAGRQRFSALFDSSSDGILILDRQGRFIDANRTAYARLGYGKKELMRMGVAGLNTPEFTRLFSGHLDLLKEKGMAVFESAHIRKDGSIMPVEINARMIELDGEQVILCVVRDISERKLFEEQLHQSQKMEAIGTLVGGIAHDFNNMLAAIQGNVYLARMLAQGLGEIEEKIANIGQLGNRAAEMVRQLLTFARKDRVSMMPFSLNSFVEEGHKLTHTLIPENIEFRNEVCVEDLQVRGDTTQLQQALMNLLNNAVDAVSGVADPEIRCALESYKADQSFHLRHPQMEGEHFACLSVKDNGCGIPADSLDKIFEPFYTTKEVGKGTGLGLSTLYGSVQRHGGTVEVASRPGEGSVFRIYLPLCESHSSDAAAEKQDDARGMGETILLVDDQQELRSTSAQVLDVLGYRVLQAANGRDALRIFRDLQGRIDLVLSDVVMPVMGGPELLQEIRRTDARLPVILVTGYDRQHVLDMDLQSENLRSISKPFDFHELSRIIQELLHP